MTQTLVTTDSHTMPNCAAGACGWCVRLCFDV